MELKRYQERVLAEIKAFLDALATEQAANNKHASLDAWIKATGRRQLPSGERLDGMGRDLPTFCIKVPTGGGKTLLATQVLGQIHSTMLRDRRGAGLVLWIVPSDQIYRDTLKALRKRDHPYREALEFAVGNRVEAWEKHEIARLTPGQLRSDLNILLLKLASTNRESKEQLKFFQGSGGNIVQHFPAEDDGDAQRALKAKIPNLDMVSDDLARTSLANMVRLCRPPVILDEGHKAYSDQAQKTLEEFNASIIVELSATPDKTKSNVLCNVSGKELLDEEMIKLPINVAISGESNWKTCLAKAKDKREELASNARAVETEKPIRPIVLVQVERTGEAQREGREVHAEHVKQHLIERLGVAESEIAIKSSEKDDIEGLDLLDEGCRITWIITKQALQEGWDCPFAYILVSLNNTQSKLSMTQLVGRVLRQPFARKTGVRELDESYVYCLHKSAVDITREIKQALEKEGYEGDGGSVVDHSSDAAATVRRTARIRREFESHYRLFDGKVYLPRFCVREGKRYEGLDYFRHLISQVDVGTFDYASIRWDLASDLANARESFYQLALGQDGASAVRHEATVATETDEQVRAWLVANLNCDLFSYLELRRVVDTVVARLVKAHSPLAGKLGLVKFTIRNRLSEFIESETDKCTQGVFATLLRTGTLTFYLQCVECRFEIPREIELRSTRQLVHNDNTAIRRSLFDFVPDESVNGLEREIALCLDNHPEVLWWYRNEVGAQHFAIQGYRRPRIYPDFVVQKGVEGKKAKWKPTPTVVVVESKGEHLAGNRDTEYKREVAQHFESLGKAVSWQDLGSGFDQSTFRFQILDGDQHGKWRDELRDILKS